MDGLPVFAASTLMTVATGWSALKLRAARRQASQHARRQAAAEAVDQEVAGACREAVAAIQAHLSAVITGQPCPTPAGTPAAGISTPTTATPTSAFSPRDATSTGLLARITAATAAQAPASGAPHHHPPHPSSEIPLPHPSAKSPSMSDQVGSGVLNTPPDGPGRVPPTSIPLSQPTLDHLTHLAVIWAAAHLILKCQAAAQKQLRQGRQPGGGAGEGQGGEQGREQGPSVEGEPQLCSDGSFSIRLGGDRLWDLVTPWLLSVLSIATGAGAAAAESSPSAAAAVSVAAEATGAASTVVSQEQAFEAGGVAGNGGGFQSGAGEGVGEGANLNGSGPGYYFNPPNTPNTFRPTSRQDATRHPALVTAPPELLGMVHTITSLFHSLSDACQPPPPPEPSPAAPSLTPTAAASTPPATPAAPRAPAPLLLRTLQGKLPARTPVPGLHPDTTTRGLLVPEVVTGPALTSARARCAAKLCMAPLLAGGERYAEDAMLQGGLGRQGDTGETAAGAAGSGGGEWGPEGAMKLGRARLAVDTVGSQGREGGRAWGDMVIEGASLDMGPVVASADVVEFLLTPTLAPSQAPAQLPPPPPPPPHALPPPPQPTPFSSTPTSTPPPTQPTAPPTPTPLDQATPATPHQQVPPPSLPSPPPAIPAPQPTSSQPPTPPASGTSMQSTPVRPISHGGESPQPCKSPGSRPVAMPDTAAGSVSDPSADREGSRPTLPHWLQPTHPPHTPQPRPSTPTHDAPATPPAQAAPATFAVSTPPPTGSPAPSTAKTCPPQPPSATPPALQPRTPSQPALTAPRQGGLLQREVWGDSVWQQQGSATPQGGEAEAGGGEVDTARAEPHKPANAEEQLAVPLEELVWKAQVVVGHAPPAVDGSSPPVGEEGVSVSPCGVPGAAGAAAGLPTISPPTTGVDALPPPVLARIFSLVLTGSAWEEVWQPALPAQPAQPVWLHQEKSRGGMGGSRGQGVGASTGVKGQACAALPPPPPLSLLSLPPHGSYYSRLGTRGVPRGQARGGAAGSQGAEPPSQTAVGAGPSTSAASHTGGTHQDAAGASDGGVGGGVGGGAGGGGVGRGGYRTRQGNFDTPLQPVSLTTPLHPPASSLTASARVPWLARIEVVGNQGSRALHLNPPSRRLAAEGRVVASLRLVCRAWREAVDGEVGCVAVRRWPRLLHGVEHLPRLAVLDCGALGGDPSPVARVTPLLLHLSHCPWLRALRMSKESLVVCRQFTSSAPQADMALLVSFPAGIASLSGLTDLACVRQCDPGAVEVDSGEGEWGEGEGEEGEEGRGGLSAESWGRRRRGRSSAGHEWLRVRLRPELSCLTRLTSLTLHDASNPLEHAPPSLRRLELRGRSCCIAATPSLVTRLTALRHLTLAEPSAGPPLTATLNAAADLCKPPAPAPARPPTLHTTPTTAPGSQGAGSNDADPRSGGHTAPGVGSGVESEDWGSDGGHGDGSGGDGPFDWGSGRVLEPIPDTDEGEGGAPLPQGSHSGRTPHQTPAAAAPPLLQPGSQPAATSSGVRAGAAGGAAGRGAGVGVGGAGEAGISPGLTSLKVEGVRQVLLGLGQGQLLADGDWEAIARMRRLRWLRVSTSLNAGLDPDGPLAALAAAGAAGGLTLEMPQGAKLPDTLEFLDLSHNGLSRLPSSVADLPRLATLRLARSALVSVPPPLTPGLTGPVPPALASLVHLDLRGCALASLPPSVCRAATRLRDLHLGHNMLHSLPPSLASGLGLTRLVVNHNALGSMPMGVAGLRELKVLDLSFNEMRHVEPEVSQLSQLSRLDLSFNRLSDLPPTLSQLAGSLVALGLTCNVLPVLPPVVTTLTALTRLDVAGQCALQYEQGKGMSMLTDAVILGVSLGGDYAMCGTPPKPQPPAPTSPPPSGSTQHHPDPQPTTNAPSSAPASVASPSQTGSNESHGSEGASGSAPAPAPAPGVPAAAAAAADDGGGAGGPGASRAREGSQRIVVAVPMPSRAACPLPPTLVCLPRLKVLVADRPCDATSLMVACVLERAGVCVRDTAMHSVCSPGAGVWEGLTS